MILPIAGKDVSLAIGKNAKEQEREYSMSNKNIDIDFNDLVENYHEVIKYAGKNSDSFSVITNLKKPYSKNPPNCEHDEAIKCLEPFLTEHVVGIKEWPGMITKDNHKVMIIYRTCKESRKILSEMPNLFLPIENQLPEDICFYRNKKPWLATVSHEKTAFMSDATNDDIAFLNDNGIMIYD